MNAGKKGLIGFSLLLAAALAFGADWTTKQLTNTTGYITEKRIAVNNANVYVIWTDDAAGPSELYFRKSADGGKTWKTPKRLSAAGKYAFTPDIAVNGSNVYVVWGQDNGLYFRKSTNGGGAWKPEVKIVTYGYPDDMRIAVSGQNVYVVWSQDDPEIPGVRIIFIMKSANGGKTWGTPTAVTDDISENDYPAVAVSGANVYVVWQNDDSISGEIFFRRSADAGKTWQEELNLSNTPTVGSWYPSIAVQGSQVYAVWYEHEYYQGIYFGRSSNSGVTWPKASKITTDAETPGAPAIAAKNALVGVAYDDMSASGTEVNLRSSIYNGAGWNLTRLTSNGRSYDPSVAYSGTKVFVLYVSGPSDSLQIFITFASLK